MYQCPFRKRCALGGLPSWDVGPFDRIRMAGEGAAQVPSARSGTIGLFILGHIGRKMEEPGVRQPAGSS